MRRKLMQQFHHWHFPNPPYHFEELHSKYTRLFMMRHIKFCYLGLLRKFTSNQSISKVYALPTTDENSQACAVFSFATTAAGGTSS